MKRRREEAKRWLDQARYDLDTARYNIPTRYPNGLPGGIPAHAFRKKDADGAIAMARKITKLVARKLDL